MTRPRPTHRIVRTSALIAALMPAAAHATINPLPEPGSWTLVALAAVAAGIVTWRNRRK